MRFDLCDLERNAQAGDLTGLCEPSGEALSQVVSFSVFQLSVAEDCETGYQFRAEFKLLGAAMVGLPPLFVFYFNPYWKGMVDPSFRVIRK